MTTQQHVACEISKLFFLFFLSASPLRPETWERAKGTWLFTSLFLFPFLSPCHKFPLKKKYKQTFNWICNLWEKSSGCVYLFIYSKCNENGRSIVETQHSNWFNRYETFAKEQKDEKERVVLLMGINMIIESVEGFIILAKKNGRNRGPKKHGRM